PASSAAGRPGGAARVDWRAAAVRRRSARARGRLRRRLAFHRGSRRQPIQGVRDRHVAAAVVSSTVGRRVAGVFFPPPGFRPPPRPGARGAPRPPPPFSPPPPPPPPHTPPLPS